MKRKPKRLLYSHSEMRLNIILASMCGVVVWWLNDKNFNVFVGEFVAACLILSLITISVNAFLIRREKNKREE